MKRETGTRLPPYSPEAERGVLGCILLLPRESIDKVNELLRLDCDPFFDDRHRTLFEVLLKLYEQVDVSDTILVVQELRDRGLLEPLGGPGYLTALMNEVPSPSSIEYYIEILNEKAFRRMAIRVCTQLIGEVYDSVEPLEKLADSVETQILGLKRKRFVQTSRAESFRRIYQRLEDMCIGVEIPGLIKTGFRDIDKTLGGLHPGDNIVIAARPGLGKSTLAMNIAEYVAIDCELPVGYFSLEMNEDKLNMRSLASRARLDLGVFGRKEAVERDYQKVSSAINTLLRAKIDILFKPGLTIAQLRANARRMSATSGVKLIIIDMMQLVEGRSENRREAVGEVSRGIKALAGDLNIPIISISAMNREIEKSENRRPRLADLKESGDIESDADVVGFLWQPKPSAERDLIMPTEFFIAKNRNGNTGEVSLLFFKKFSRFESVENDPQI